ncbi:MAG: LamB/YcsF family protein, partial [Verrucomicrobiota bacterium]
MKTVDLNADLGEGSPGEEVLFGVATSVNIACGGHAGGVAAMRAAVRAARSAGVSVGAHPGYADPEYFGRRELSLTPGQVTALVSAQVALLAGIARDEGVVLRHVKPHGALYNQAARDGLLAAAVVAGARASAPGAGLF